MTLSADFGAGTKGNEALERAQSLFGEASVVKKDTVNNELSAVWRNVRRDLVNYLVSQLDEDETGEAILQMVIINE